MLGHAISLNQKSQDNNAMHAKPDLRVEFEPDDRVFRLGDLCRYPTWLRLHELLKKYWPRTIWDFLALQLRIGLSLVIIVPALSQWRTLWPGVGLGLLFCFGPILALIFIVNRKTLVWTSILLLFSAVGGLAGTLIADITYSPFNTDHKGIHRHSRSTDYVSYVIIGTTLFWWLAVQLKRRYDGSESDKMPVPRELVPDPETEQ